MALNRLCYIIYFKHKNVLKKIMKIDGIDVYYTSEKSKYVTVYIDKSEEKRIKAALTKIRGVRSFEESLLDKAKVNINL